MLFHLPLEPFESRYTSDYWRWFGNEYTKRGIEHQYVPGISLTNKIEIGRFLDVYNTVYWKSTQIAAVANLFRGKQVKDGDVFFSTDLWHPGIENIAYMAQLSDIKIKIFGLLHAGTYDPNDFVSQKGLGRWGQWAENSWLALVDKVFVATQYHRSLLISERGEADPENVKVTGFMLYYQELLASYGQFINKDKIRTVVFPHRLDPEKQPEKFDQLVQILASEFPDVVWIKTHEQKGNKELYYRTLARSTVSVSFAKQETFGLAMLESAVLGCSIVVPNQVSYKEMYPKKYQYSTFDEAVNLVRQFLNKPEPVGKYVYAKYSHSIEKMIDYMEID